MNKEFQGIIITILILLANKTQPTILDRKVFTLTLVFKEK